MTTPFRRAAITPGFIAMILVLAGAGPASAALIVYEGFDVTGGVNGSTLNGKAGASSTGFDPGSSWSVTTAGPGSSVTYETTGLTFSDIPVTGGLANVNSGTVDSSGNSGDGARALNVAATGTIYGSYLVSPAAILTSRSISSVLVGSQATVTSDDSGSQWDYEANADVFGSSDGGGRINGATPSGDFTNTGTALSTGVTYLVLYEMQNLVNTGSASQTLTEWILTAAQYDNFKTGGLTDTELNGASVGSGSTNVTQKGTKTGTFSANLTTADYMHIFSVLGTARARFDELRISDASLNEAVGMPEPATLGLVAAGGLMLLRRRRNGAGINRR